jgi:hypothetical protein
MAGAMAARSIEPAIRRGVALVTLLLGSAFGIVGGPVEAQVSGRPTDQDLRLEWTAAEDRRGRPIVSGYVYNQRAGSYASSMRLQVEALDASGQAVGSTTGFVFGDVPPSGRSYFEIKAPARAASYRVTIQTFTWRAYGAGGG